MQLQDMTKEQLLAKVMQMQTDSQRKLSCKVSEKGAVSVYGLGRFPVTLYASQWERLSEFVIAGTVARFIEANATLVSRKD